LNAAFFLSSRKTANTSANAFLDVSGQNNKATIKQHCQHDVTYSSGDLSYQALPVEINGTAKFLLFLALLRYYVPTP
jgi:hypothetical protein